MRHSRSFASAFSLRTAAKGGLCLSRKGRGERSLPTKRFKQKPFPVLARPMSFVQAILDGLLIGGVYAVISIGLTLVYGVMGIVNFAQAEFLTIGMFVAWFAWAFLGLDPVMAAPLSFAVAFAIGWVVQGQLISRVLTAPSVAQIFLTVGILIVIENGSLLLFGSAFL